MGVEKRMIYQKPLTEEDAEGMAHLVSKIDEHNNLEKWKVHFIDDPPGVYYTRLVKKAQEHGHLADVADFIELLGV